MKKNSVFCSFVRLKKVALKYLNLFGLDGIDFVLEIHAEEICNDPVCCIIPQVWINIMNLLGLKDKVTYVLMKGVQIVRCLV